MLGSVEGEYEFAAIRRALIKLFPDTSISQEKTSVPDRKPSHVSDRKSNDRFKNRFRKLRDGKSGCYTAHETDARDTEESPNSEEEESGEEETDLTAAFERQMMSWLRWWKNWKTRSTCRTWKFRESSLSGAGRGKGKAKFKGSLFNRRNSQLVVLTVTVFDTGLVTRSVRRKTQMMRRHMSGAVFCRKQCTFIVTSSISVEQELRGAGACDTCCNRTVAG